MSAFGGKADMALTWLDALADASHYACQCSLLEVKRIVACGSFVSSFGKVPDWTVVQCFIATVREILDQSPCPPTRWWGKYPTEKKNATQREDLAMERIVIVSILSALLVQLQAARATAEGNYKKICRVSLNLRVLDDSADANSCRAIAVELPGARSRIGMS